MKIVVLSDLNWEQHLRSMSFREVESASLVTVQKSRYQSILRYLTIVLEEKADVVLVAGDVTGDGSCGHGFHYAFMMLVSILDQLEIPSCFISGNHDEHQYYKQVVDFVASLKYTQEVSNKEADIKGVKILGVPYETTYSKSKIKSLIERYSDTYDIVMAHSQLKRRIRLFELNAKLIVTGHYDRKLFGFAECAFISLDNDNEEISYATMKMNEQEYETTICIKDKNGSVHSYSDKSDTLFSQQRSHTVSIDSMPSIDLRILEMHARSKFVDQSGLDRSYLKYLRGTQYLKLLERLHVVKNDKMLKPTLRVTKNVVGIQITENYKVSESLVIDYLGKRTRG